jgi:hypothetical protein
MKRFFLIVAALLLSFSFANAFKLKNGSYLVKYKFINFAVSPTVGEHKYEILIKNKRAVKAIDLNNAKEIALNKVFGLQEVVNFLRGNKKNLIVKYKRGIYILKPKKIGYFKIFIESIKRVNSNINLNPLNRKKIEFQRNYNSWIRKGIKNYKIRIQDSNFANEFTEGVELRVRNGKIVSARDIRNYKYIKVDNRFLTVKNLFSLVRADLKNARVDYNLKYKYPSYIKFSNGRTIAAFYLKPLR